jgi:hypothetical protein
MDLLGTAELDWDKVLVEMVHIDDSMEVMGCKVFIGDRELS